MKSTVSGVAVIAGFSLICHFWIFVSCDHNPCLGHYNRDFASNVPDPALRDIDERKWYRFEKHESTDDERQGCKSVLQSGDKSQIWLHNYQAPNDADPAKSVEVCARILHGKVVCCQWNGTISVHFCSEAAGDYYVYQLKEPPVCNKHYCSGDGVRCERSCAWNVNQSSCTCPSAYPVTEAPKLKSPRVISGTTLVTDSHNPGRTFYPTKFEVDCEVKYPRQTVDDGARFDVVFEVDGRYLTHFTVDSTNPVATLDESFLAGHLGKELTCKVSSHWDSSDLRSRNFTSNGHWFGLNPVYENGSVISHNLVVKEGEKTSLRLTSTFPITTRPCFNLSLHEPCPYTSYLFHVSTNGGFKLSECEIIFNDNSNRSAELEIAPIPAVGTRPKPVVWQLNFEPYHDDANLNSQDTPAHKLPIFKGYRIQSVNIEVRAGDVPPECLSMGDPHITTFPNAAETRRVKTDYF